MQKIRSIFNSIKMVIFQFIFVIHHNSIKNKYILIMVELLQIFSLLYFYINPIYSQLHNFDLISQFFDQIWPQLFIFIKNSQFLIPFALLLIFPAIFISICIMKVIVGYQYLLILAIQIWLLFYPVFFIKFSIETVNIILGFPNYRFIGIIIALFHVIGSLMVLHLCNKKYKFIDLLPIILIYANANQYAVLSIVTIRLILSYFMATDTLIKPLRLRFQFSLLLVILFSYFAADTLTSYISFLLMISFFSIPEVISIIQNFHKYDSIFYHLENLNEEESDSRLRYYDFVQDHRINCQSSLCKCRFLGKYKQHQEIKQKGYEFVQSLYSFKEDFYSRIELGEVSCSQYQYTLSGLILLFQLKPVSLYQQYLLYYVKTKYEQQYRKHDKNYTFGQKYHNAYEDLCGFEERIQNLTKILKDFWITILEFDGSKKFLSMILNISERITQIRVKYEEYIDKYEEFSNNFRYLYKTFQIAILNLLDKEKQQNSHAFGTSKQQINIKVPQRQLFFVSNSAQQIINCNRQFCNLVEFDKQDLINKSYNIFVPKICTQEHSIWVRDWYQNYNRQEQATQLIKPIQLMSQYTKAVKMQNKILPRFEKGIQIITFIKLINKLQHSSLNKTPSAKTGSQLNSQVEQLDVETFFSFLIERNSMKIVGMDDSFFYTTMIDQSDDLRKKILNLKLNQMFPKVVLHQKQKQGVVTFVNQAYRQAMLNYSVLQQFIQCKQKNLAITNIAFASKNNLFIPKTRQKSIIGETQDQRLSFARKSRKKLSTLQSNATGGLNSHIKQNSQQVFNYEIIDQKNVGLQIPYCLVNFKLKKNIIFDADIKSKNLSKNKLSSQIIKDQAKNSEDAMDEVNDEQNSHLLNKKNSQNQNTSFLTALAHRQPFIRSSKPFKEDTGEQQVENKKAQIQESQEFNEEQKNFCLPWPILIPLFIMHGVYLHISNQYMKTFQYLRQTFNFYDMYELQILRRVGVIFDNTSHIQDLKSLWIQGYGFYHSSIITFQNPTDPYFQNKLYEQLIKQNHYGIYELISNSLENRNQSLNIFFYLIIAALSVGLFYVTVDFILSIRYSFKISNKVTEIILIFLNISQNDINKLLYSISKYQNEVLEIVDFAQIQRQKKLQRQDYKIDAAQTRQLAQLSGIGLLKQQQYGFGIQSNLRNVDSLGNSPLKNDSKIISQPIHQIYDQNNPNIIVPKNNRARKSSMSNHRRRSSRAQKLDFEKLKQSMAQLKCSEDQRNGVNDLNYLIANQSRNSFSRKSGFSKGSLSSQDFQQKDFQSPDNIINKMEQQESQLSPQQEAKLQQINKFKRRFRGKLNDIRQNPRSYTLLFIVLILIAGVLIGTLVLIPRFISNFQLFSNVYFNLRKVKIILFKELMKKATLIPLLPDDKSSVYTQDFYFKVRDQLNQIPDFQNFWQQVYSNNVCPLVKDPTINSLCLQMDSSMTAYGQKVMFQYLQDYLRRKNASALFRNSSKDAIYFMIISRIQANLVTQGEQKMGEQVQQYMDKVLNYELLIVIIGTLIFLFCIILARKALNDIKQKINDGQNLLLVMPENVKKKYIQQMKKNRMKQLTKDLKSDLQKRRTKKRKSKTLKNKFKNTLQQGQQTGNQLMGNNSSLLQREQQSVLKQALKSPSKQTDIINTKTQDIKLKQKISKFKP